MEKKLKAIRFIDKDPTKALFFSTLRKRVDQYFKNRNLSKHSNAQMVSKTIVLLSAYILPFIAILFFKPVLSWSLVLWGIMGLAFAGIGMSIMHDANHGAYTAKHKLNKLLGHTINLLGGSATNWKLQHNVLHHTYTNVATHDLDIQDKVILRFSPHTDVKWYHKLQIIYAFFFYGITTLYWAFLKDFLQFNLYKKNGLNTNKPSANRKLLLAMIFDKLLYTFVFLLMPIIIFHIPAQHIIVGFLFMHFIAGVVHTVIFQLAHTVEGTSYPLPDESNTIQNNWAVHQMHTTVNFCRHNAFLSWYVGGLNFQIEHHLFPTICHVHYPAISEIVKQTAEEFGIPYLENKTFAMALQSHVSALIKFGQLPKLNEAIV